MTAVSGPVQAGTEEEEPNDTMETALPIQIGRAGIGDGEIGPANDVDYYKFESAVSKTYVVEVLNVTSGLGRMVMHVYDADATQVAVDDYCNTGTGNVCGRAQFTTQAAGTYYVRLEAYSSSATGTYALRVLPRYDQGATWDAGWEPDDVAALAPKIKIGRTEAVQRSIQPRNPDYLTINRDYDTLRFDAPGARSYVVEVFDVADVLGRMRVAVYNASGTLLRQDDYCNNGSGHVCGRVQVDVPAAGTYFLVLSPYSSSSSGTYSVRVLQRYDQGLSWDSAWESDDVPSLAPLLDVGRKGGVRRVFYPLNPDFVTVYRDVDYVRFEVPDPGVYSVELYNVAEVLGRVQLRVYDQAGTSFGVDDYCNSGTGNVCARVRVEAQVAGTYFIRTNAYGASATGSYSIRVLPRYDDGLTWGTDREVNDTPDLAYRVKAGKTLAETIYPRNPAYTTVAGDYDYYRIATKKNREYVVTVRDVSESLGDTALTIFDSAGAVVADSQYCGETDAVCNELRFRSAQSGDYVIRVRPYDSNHNGSFKVCARLTTQSCAKPTIPSMSGVLPVA